VAEVDLQGAAEALGDGAFAEAGEGGFEPSLRDGEQAGGFAECVTEAAEEGGGGEVFAVTDEEGLVSGGGVVDAGGDEVDEVGQGDEAAVVVDAAER
jgi:hypothetical protein